MGRMTSHISIYEMDNQTCLKPLTSFHGRFHFDQLETKQFPAKTSLQLGCWNQICIIPKFMTFRDRKQPWKPRAENKTPHCTDWDNFSSSSTACWVIFLLQFWPTLVVRCCQATHTGLHIREQIIQWFTNLGVHFNLRNMVLHYHGSLSSGKLDRHQSPVGTSACRISKPTWHGADSHISRLKHHKKEKKHGLTSYKPARNQLQIGMSSPKSSGICIYIYIMTMQAWSKLGHHLQGMSHPGFPKELMD